MRKKIETRKLDLLAIESTSLDTPVSWKNELGEIFVYFGGELIEYTDTRIIHHEDDGLVNLRLNELEFDLSDENLPEMEYSS